MQLQRKEGRKSEGEMIEGWREKEKKEERRKEGVAPLHLLSPLKKYLCIPPNHMKALRLKLFGSDSTGFTQHDIQKPSLFRYFFLSRKIKFRQLLNKSPPSFCRVL